MAHVAQWHKRDDIVARFSSVRPRVAPITKLGKELVDLSNPQISATLNNPNHPIFARDPKPRIIGKYHRIGQAEKLIANDGQYWLQTH